MVAILILVMYYSAGLQAQVSDRPLVMAALAECKLRTVVYDIPRTLVGRAYEDFSIMPPCVELRRCSGCCRDSGKTRCEPYSKRLRTFEVDKYYYFQSQPRHHSVQVKLEEHLGCECAPILPDEDLAAAGNESVRLVNGTGLCSGRVEVRSDQSWASLCEADLDWQDADVVCREIDCGAPSALRGALYDEGKDPIRAKKFQCKGNESRLLDCDTSGSDRNTCSPGKAAWLTCRPDDVRLAGGGSRCAGRVEMRLQGEWRLLDNTDSWSMRSAAIVCRQLRCGSAISARKIPAYKVLMFTSNCNGYESGLRECGRVKEGSNAPDVNEVVCSDLLFQPIISLSSSMQGVSEGQQQGPQVFKDHSFNISCSIQPQYPGGSFHLTLTGSNTTLRHTHPAVNHSTHFLFPAADHGHQGNYSCVYEVYVFSQNFTSESEVLSVTVAYSPLTEFINRLLLIVVVMTLVISTAALYLFFKTTRGQRPVEKEDQETASLRSSAEAGPGEEGAAQSMEQEEATSG